MSTEILWISPTDFVTGDPTLHLEYPSLSHPAVEVRCTAAGDLKWVFLGLRLPSGSLIKAVRICYRISNRRSLISQVRLTEMHTADSAVVQHDDPTDLRSTVSTCYVSEVGTGTYRPRGAVTLALRLKFSNVDDKITLGPIGVDLETCQIRVANVKCFGAVGDGSKDDHRPIQDAIEAVVSDGGGTVYLPAGTYLTKKPLRVSSDGVSIRGEGRGVTVVKNASTNLLHVSDTVAVQYFILENIELESLPGGGDIIVVRFGMSQSTIRGARLLQRNNGKSLYRQVNTLDRGGSGGYGNLVSESWLNGHTAPTVPQWHVEVKGNRYNSNTFERLRCRNSGCYFFHLESTRRQAPLSGNAFRDIWFGHCTGGKIKLLSCVGTLLQECVSYDDRGRMTNHGFYVGRASSTLNQSTYTTFINCDRRTGALSGGFKDIKLGAGECNATTVINCGGTAGAGVTHDFGNTPTTAIGMSALVTLEGTARTTMVSSSGITTPP